LSAYQVSEKGDLANWALSEKDLRAVGGAMDLIAGVEKVFVAVQHTSPKGAPRIVNECTFPITAKGVVSLIFTDLAVVQVVPEGLILKEIAPGLSMEQVQSVTEPKLIISKDLCDMQF
jgi:3-oxoacid CoA-transferase B subunit